MAEADAKKWPDARESFRTADRLQPDTPMPLLMQVRVNYSAGDFDAVKSNLRDLAIRFPHNSSAHTAAARFLAEHNLFVLALAEALRAERDSDDWNEKIQLAVLENTVGAYSDSMRTSFAIEQNRNLPDAARGAAAGIIGLSYESLQNTQEATKYLQEAIHLDASQENSYLALADLQSDRPVGVAGESFLINGQLYAWSNINVDWEHVGNLLGPTGPQGVTGEPGTPGGPPGPTGPTGAARRAASRRSTAPSRRWSRRA